MVTNEEVTIPTHNIAMDGILNMRDLATASPSKVAPGKFFRTGCVSSASPEDIRKIDELGHFFSPLTCNITYLMRLLLQVLKFGLICEVNLRLRKMKDFILMFTEVLCPRTMIESEKRGIKTKQNFLLMGK